MSYQGSNPLFKTVTNEGYADFATADATPKRAGRLVYVQNEDKVYLDDGTNLNGITKDSDVLMMTSTGIITGGALTVNATNTLWDLAAGSAIIVDNTDASAPVINTVVWTAQAGLTVAGLLTDPRTNVALSLTNAASPGVSYGNSFSATVNGASQTVYIAEKVENFSSAQFRLFAGIGRLVHSNLTNLSFTVDLQRHIESVLSSLTDYVDLFPAKNVDGNEFSGVGATASVQKSLGHAFRYGSNFINDTSDPNIQQIPAANPTTHFYRYRDGSGGWAQSASSTVLDGTQYDDGSGTLQTIPNNRFTIQTVFVFAGSGSMFIQYGQEFFASQDAAIVALPSSDPVLDPNLVNDAVFRGYFIVAKNITDTTDSAQFLWRAPLGELGGGTGTGVVVDLQSAYNASSDPEIVTDSSRAAVTFKRGSALDTDDVLEVLNGSDVQNFAVTGEGNVTGNTFNGVALTTGGVATNFLDEQGNYTVPAGGAVDSVFGRTGAVIAVDGDYDLDELGDVDLTGAVDGQVLKRSAGVWVPGNDNTSAEDINFTYTNIVNNSDFKTLQSTAGWTELGGGTPVFTADGVLLESTPSLVQNVGFVNGTDYLCRITVARPSGSGNYNLFVRQTDGAGSGSSFPTDTFFAGYSGGGKNPITADGTYEATITAVAGQPFILVSNDQVGEDVYLEKIEIFELPRNLNEALSYDFDAVTVQQFTFDLGDYADTDVLITGVRDLVNNDGNYTTASGQDLFGDSTCKATLNTSNEIVLTKGGSVTGGKAVVRYTLI